MRFARSRLMLRAAVIVGLAVAACAPEAASPEDQIRHLLTEMEANAEAGELRALKATLSEHYSDEYGNDRRAVSALLTHQFLRHREIHLLTRIDAVAIDSDGSATAGLFVAMAGRPIAGAGVLHSLRADLYRFDFVFAPEPDGWRVTSAAWHPARFEDFD